MPKQINVLTAQTMDSHKAKGFYCTYNNPKREAYHEAGHIVALFLLSGDIKGTGPQRENPNKSRQAFTSAEDYQAIFNEVCFWVAGGVGERVHCMLRGLPKNTMVEDIDTLSTFAKHVWQFPFKHKIKGFPSCPILENLINSAEDVIEALFRDDYNSLKLRAVADYLISRDLVSPNALTEIRKDPKSKNELLRILKTKHG